MKAPVKGSGAVLQPVNGNEKQQPAVVANPGQDLADAKDKIVKDESSNESSENRILTVVKRDGSVENVLFDKIRERLEKLMYGLNKSQIDPAKIVIKVSQGITNNITTVEIDNLAADIAASMVILHPDYAILAARILVSSLHKETSDKFSDAIEAQYNRFDPISQKVVQSIPDEIYKIVIENQDKLNSAIDYSRDFNYNFFAISTLMKSYLSRISGKIIERPQHMLMRVAIGIHKHDIDAAINSYQLLSQKYFIHATPTLFSSGHIFSQLSSCFLLSISEDSIDGIFDTLKDCAIISKYSGGLGLAISNVRSNGSQILGVGTKGFSRGIIPMIQVYASMTKYVNQAGHRPGALALYLEPWHADLMSFLELRRNQGNEDARARNIFTALWVPDLFMKRVEGDQMWTFMCPQKCPGLQDAYGDEFEALYEKYEKEGRGVSQMPARKIFHSIIENQIETGTPYICYKDSVNKKSMQSNLGTIRCSNLCAEIVEYTSKEETAVCNLASINLSAYVDEEKMTYDFDKLYEVSKVACNNLDKAIDASFHPIKQASYSNYKNRPVGIGVQGLADVFMKLKYPFDSQDARTLNKKIFETIYYGAIEMSCENAEKKGHYESYPGSPASKGLLQFDLWGVKPSFDKWDWNALKERIRKFGLRNSLVTACMPTASTSNIQGSIEATEPITSNIYIRRVLSGEFQMVNQYLINDLLKINLWNKKIKNKIIANNGSIQTIDEIPNDMKLLYRTVWEIPQKSIIDMAADRGPFIDQTQSMNIFISQPNFQNMSSMHFYGWKKGLKTGMYYLRSKPAVNAIKFTIEKENSTSSLNSNEPKKTKFERYPSADKQSQKLLCSIENGPDCKMCGA